jgi:hypothetical protein
MASHQLVVVKAVSKGFPREYGICGRQDISIKPLCKVAKVFFMLFMTLLVIFRTNKKYICRLHINLAHVYFIKRLLRLAMWLEMIF